jgi:hypothetical protein
MYKRGGFNPATLNANQPFVPNPSKNTPFGPGGLITTAPPGSFGVFCVQQPAHCGRLLVGSVGSPIFP